LSWGFRVYRPLRRSLLVTIYANSNEMPDDKVLLPFTTWDNRWSYLYANTFQGYERKYVRVRPFMILSNGDEYSPFKKKRIKRSSFGYTPKDVVKNKKVTKKDTS